MTGPRLIYTGNVIVDIVMSVDAVPEAGGDVIASHSQITAGGGYNVMVAAQRDGLHVLYAGQYGTGPFGDVVRAALESSGFDLAQTGIDTVDSGYCVALVDASAERTFVTSVGAESRLDRADLDRIAVSDDDIVYVSGYGLAHPRNAVALVGWLEDLPSNVVVITDPSPLIADLDETVLARVLERTDVLSANAREARIATGADDLAAAAIHLAPRIRNNGAVLVRDGARGCWLTAASTADAPVLIDGFPVDAVDTNGAGDAHGGVLAAALARGVALADAVVRANAAAALAVTKRGPATAPTSSEIDALLAGRSPTHS
ncbi:PfkB family carbohydrate kinase [Mycolicibacterium sediminis]|uniref:Sugar kinase n=1 Tax=Mycolicibacterium sediminis TaxID=1286180 RepID=A0A7I7QWE6_9MYCO|nr:PfkB family carbohydrate kinase [Mycolicibacterium sediminis]BBY30683.1 sugar kinase [Mycolicibacterium sediminis]